MKGPKPPARDLFRAWGDSVVPVEDPSTSSARRDRIVARMGGTIERAAAERRQSRRRAWWAYGVASAAVAMMAVGVAWRMHGHGAASNPADTAVVARVDRVARARTIAGSVKATGNTGQPLLPSANGDIALGAGDEVVTEPDGKSDVTLADGVSIALEGSSHVALPPSPALHDDGREVVRFDRGIVHVRVPPMPAGHTFSVKTPDAEVTVHGTAFTVEVAPVGSSTATRVRVTEGVVSVKSERDDVLLTAGMEWPRVAAGPSLPELLDAPNRTARANPPLSVHHAHDERSPSPQPMEASSLAEQNELLAHAMDASRAGDDRRAVDLLNDLLKRYSASPLAQEARVQRFRALERMGNHRGAAREARLYLATYPTGFAREEAKALALKP